jgi:alpha-tubulin suppressor-like RCC1 family protein
VASGAVARLLFVATRVEAGEHFACALTRSPSLICWGQNDRGQLGRDSVATTGEPAAVSLEAGAIVDDFCVGANHACAIVGGDVLCWGDDELGQVRDPARVVVRAPYAAWTESPATAVSCGRDHTCVQSAEGITCFGSDEFAVVSGAPRPFSGTLLRTGALASTAFAWSESGGLLAWGSNRYGLASPVDATTYVDLPTPVRTP